MEGNRTGFKILKGSSNYHTWKVAAKAMLDYEDLWYDVIELAASASGSTGSSGTAVDKRKDSKARARILHMVDEEIYSHVQDCKSAKEAWETLSKMYDDRGLSRRVGLLRRLITTTLGECKSMDAYVNRIISTSKDLNGVGFPISEEWVGSFLLAGLGDEYKPMIMALENSGTPITGDAIRTKLLQEEVLDDDDNKAFKAFRKSQGQKRIQCRTCSGWGHTAKNCANRKKKNDASGASSKSEDAFCVVLSAIGSNEGESWYFDSGATSHITNDHSMMSNTSKSTGKVMAANKGVMEVKATGTVMIEPEVYDGKLPINGVLYVPELSSNLLSVGRIVSHGYSVLFTSKGCTVKSADNRIVATGTLINGLFKLEQKKQSKTFACVAKDDIELWHRRMGHLNYNSLKALSNGLATGIGFKNSHHGDCRVCPMGKQSRLPFPKEGSRATEVLELIHSDLGGPKVPSLAGSKWYVTFIDDKTRRIWIYFLKSKSEECVTRAFKDFKAFVENQSGKRIKTLRTDNGKEYINLGFDKLLRNLGIRHQTSNVHTPQQNGLAERVNRSIQERSTCMLAETGLPLKFWAESTAYAVYLLNRSPHSGIGMTPEEAWSGKKPDLSHIRLFGTTVMVQVPKATRRKQQLKATECILVGFDETTKGYRVCDIKKEVVFKSRDVKFIDEGRLNPNLSTVPVEDCPESERYIVIGNPNDDSVDSDSSNESDESEVESSETEYETVDENEADETLTDNLDEATNALPLPNLPNPSIQGEMLGPGRRKCRIPGKYSDYQIVKKGLPPYTSRQVSTDVTATDITNGSGSSMETAGFVAPPLQFNRRRDESTHEFRHSDGGRIAQGNMSLLDRKELVTRPDFPQDVSDPTTLKEAMNHPNADQWKLAMEAEYQSLLDNGTWECAELPEGRKAINTKWVFRTKRDCSGKVIQYKARLVAKGYTQRKGEDYDETYSPVVRNSSLRYLFAYAINNGLMVHQMDAISAFLQGDIEEEIYITQPQGFEGRHGNGVCKLKKAIYGLKQSSRVWNQHLDAKLKQMGFQPSAYDSCVYIMRRGDKIFIIAVYVDDLLLLTACPKWLQSVKSELMSTFKMKDMGKASQCLGMRIVVNDNSISLDQEHYVESILERFGMADSSSVSTPLNKSEVLSHDMSPTNDSQKERMKNVPYQEAVGSLMYLAQSTRPDIVYAVNRLSSFNKNPGEGHWRAVKHLLRYLRGTSTYKLIYNKSDCKIAGYSDADFAGDPDDRISTTGFVFLASGGAISWASRKQRTSSLSSHESEYVAMSITGQEALWWRGIEAELCGARTIPLYCDNQSAIATINANAVKTKSKHIEVRYHFIKQSVAENQLEVKYIATNDQPADIFTKALEKIKHERFCAMIGVRPNA